MRIRTILLLLVFLPAGLSAGNGFARDSVKASDRNNQMPGSPITGSSFRPDHYFKSRVQHSGTDSVSKNFLGARCFDLAFRMLTVTYERLIPAAKMGISLSATITGHSWQTGTDFIREPAQHVYYSRMRKSGLSLAVYRYFTLVPGKLQIRAGGEVGGGKFFKYKWEQRSRYSPGGNLMTWYAPIDGGKSPYGMAGAELGIRCMITERLAADLYGAIGRQLRREYSYQFESEYVRTQYTDKFRTYYHGGIVLGYRF